MSLDPEMIKGLLNDPDETEYVEDFRERQGMAPVFEHAVELDRVFSTLRVDESEIIDAWNATKPELTALDGEASEQGLMGEEASITGPSLSIPTIQTDLINLSSTLSIPDLRVIDNTTLDRNYLSDTAIGLFSGFTLRFQETEDEKYVPRVAYQVATQAVDLPMGHVSLFATGIVGQSQLIFERDAHLEALAPLLQRLYDICGDTPPGINMINMAFAQTKIVDASLLRHVAYHAEKIIKDANATSVAKIEDALTDLIGFYIDTKDNVFIKTQSFTLYPEIPNGQVEYFEAEDEPFSVQNRSIGLEFLDNYIYKNGELVKRAGRVLNFVFVQQNRNLCVPVAKINEYSKL